MLLLKQFIIILIINFICFNCSIRDYPMHSSLRKIEHKSLSSNNEIQFKGAVYQFVCGFGVPFRELQYESITSGIAFKTKYLLPKQTKNPRKQIFFKITSRSFRSQGYKHTIFDTFRWNVYELLAVWADKFNLNGHVCVLKSVCEAAQREFNLQSGDVWHDIAHLLFLPQASLDQLVSKFHKDFVEAALPDNSQKPNNTCHAQYAECPRSVLSIFSNILN